MNPKYTLGLDFGTSSARACILNIDTGEVVSSHANDYSGGDHGIYSDPDNPLVARQSPKDYLETLYICHSNIGNVNNGFSNLLKSISPFSNDGVPTATNIKSTSSILSFKLVLALNLPERSS